MTAPARVRRHRRSTEIRVGANAAGLAAVVILAFGWSYYCVNRGWYLQADFSNLTDAHHASLSWAYLREPIGGHFGPIGRLMYWLLDTLAPMNYAVTIAVRLGLQAVATVLLYRVIVRLSVAPRLALLIVSLYAVNPILIASLAWLSGGLTLPIAEIFVLLAIDLHLRRRHVGSIRDSAIAGVMLALAVFSYDGAVIMALVLPILSVSCLFEGSFTDRCRHTLHDWPGWLATVLPLAIGVVLTLVLADSQGAQTLAYNDLWSLISDAGTKTVAPTLVGGPWRWYADTGIYVPYVAPTDTVVLVGEAAAFLLVLIGIRFGRWRVVTGIAIVLVVLAGQISFAGVGRYSTLASLVAITPRYSSFVPLALAIAVTTSLPVATMVEPHTSETRHRVLVLCLSAALVVSNLVSVGRFTTIWSANPARGYTENLVRGARDLGPTVNIYDTAVRPDVINSIEPAHHVSDILALEGVTAHFDNPGSEPLVVRPDGQLAKSVFVAAATAAGATRPECGIYLAGQGTWLLTLDQAITPAEWFLRLDYYQPAKSKISVVIVNQDGSTTAPVSGTDYELGTLASLSLRLPTTNPAGVRVTTHDSSASLCLARVAVGGPFPVS